MPETEEDLPLSCVRRTSCWSAIFRSRVQAEDLIDLQDKLERAEVRIVEVETAMAVRTGSADLGRARETIHGLQSIDLAQRASLDRWAEECTILRRIMRTNGLDIEAVNAIVDDALGRRARSCDG